MSKTSKLQPVMVLPQRGPKIVASTARIYSPGYAVRLGIDLLNQAVPEVKSQDSISWTLFVVKDKKEIHLQYTKEESPTTAKSWRNGPKAKSIMVNIGPALRALGIGAYDAIGTYEAQTAKHKIIVAMSKKIGDK